MYDVRSPGGTLLLIPACCRVVAQEALEEGGLQGDEGVGIKRSRSDATNLTNSLSEERPLRHVRPNRQYASDYYETPDWQGMLGEG